VKAKILKSFPYSGDGINIEQYEAGTEREVVAVLFPGLEREGFVQAIPLTKPDTNAQRSNNRQPGNKPRSNDAGGGQS
jgi:hypothetical protein